jgi:hypothetical protein
VKLRGNYHVILGAGLVFITMFVLHAFISQRIPYDADDWVYLSGLTGYPVPIPSGILWNPTRILPEYLMPLAGYFSAYVVYPIIGNYILSISVTTALLLGAFLCAFYVSLFRLFSALNKDKSACALCGLFVLALCYAMFLSRRSGNLHLFITYSLNLHYFYTLPNILNSIAVCELLRLYIIGSLSFKNIPQKTPGMIVLMFFCVFSMLFSALVLLAFSVSILVIEFLKSIFKRKVKLASKLKHFGIDCVRHHNIVVISTCAVVYAMVAESFGGRANWDSGITYFGSVFSIEFLYRAYEASRSVLGIAATMNRYIFILFLMVVCAAAGVFIFSRKKEPKSPYFKAAMVALLSCVLAFLFVVLVSAKGGLQYARDIRATYGIFFFGILFISLATLYLHKKTAIVRAVFPLVIVVVVLIAINARWPYAYTPARTNTQLAYIEAFIEKTVEADRNNESSVELVVPKYDTPDNWPFPMSWWGGAFSDTLHSHGIISRRIEVVLTIDESLPSP